MMKKEKIILSVELDEGNVPTKLSWTSSDNPSGESVSEAKAFLLSLFSKSDQETLKIDLWTKEMQVAEMDRLFYNTIKGLSETYKKATNNTPLAEDMAHFAQYFGEKTEILPKTKEN